MKRHKPDARLLVDEVFVSIAILSLLACILIPAFCRLDKNTEMNLRTIGSATFLFSAAYLIGWFMTWLFNVARPKALLTTLVLATAMLWLLK